MNDRAGKGDAQGRAPQDPERDPHPTGQDRSAMFDEAQSGARSDVETEGIGEDSEAGEAVNDLAIDQREHQDRGQSDVEREEAGQDIERE